MAKTLTSKEIGFKLKQLRQQAGFSQERMAEVVGISIFQLQKYESGQNMMNTDKLQRVANALSVPVQAFFTEMNEYLPMAVAEQLLLDSYRAIDNKQLQESYLDIVVKFTHKK